MEDNKNLHEEELESAEIKGEAEPVETEITETEEPENNIKETESSQEIAAEAAVSEVRTTAALQEKPAKKTLWERGAERVTRRFLIIALAGAVLANTALTAGVTSLTYRSAGSSRQEMHRMDRPDSFGHDHRKSESKGGRSGNGQIISPDQNGQTEIPDQNGQAAAPEQTSRASIGIVIRDDSGVYISQVTGENAKKAGFAEGDKIISVDGKSIGSSSDLISEIQSHSAGDTVSITVEREGQSVEISTVLE